MIYKTTDSLILALVNMGALVSKNKEGEIVARFIEHIDIEKDENGLLHIHGKNSSTINLAAHKHGIESLEITLSSI